MLTLKFLAIIAGLVAVVYFGTQIVQQRLLYFPDTRRTTPQDAGLDGVSERTLISADGSAILTWWGDAHDNHPTLIYFHGNAGSFLNLAERIRKYMARGYNIVMMTYRGYGGSGGSPSERANVMDALAVYDAVRTSGVPEDRIILYGESLGTGIAIQVAAQRPVAGLILDAPYTSIVDLAGLHYPFLPARWLMSDRYESSTYASQVSAPVLIVHGEADRIIPVEMARRLAAAFPGPCEVATFPEAGHSDHFLHGSYDVIFSWLARHTAKASKDIE